jgi:hypothetical protein
MLQRTFTGGRPAGLTLIGRTRMKSKGDSAVQQSTVQWSTAAKLEEVPVVAQPSISVPEFAAEMIAICGRNLDALMAAQRAILEGNKTLLERQIEVYRSSLDAVLKTAGDIGSDPDLRSNVGKRFEATKNLISDSVGNSNIISELSARGNAQVVQILQGRLAAMIDEMQAAFDKVLSSQPVTNLPPAVKVRAA